jgi:hypothetical protein
VSRTQSSRVGLASVHAQLSPADGEVLDLVCAQRVLTSDQIERLFPGVPPRTLRYRTARLVRLGLLGRTRPYRASGSAPFHFWPTRAADDHRRGAPRGRGGERDAPNPAFLAHAAAISELYIALRNATAGPGLVAFHREAAAREPFAGGSRAIAPDVRVELEDEQGRALVAHVEVDLGTMGHRRLVAKAAGYVAYADSRVWRERYSYHPALLFLTTTQDRATAFLGYLARLGKKSGEFSENSWSTAAACAFVETPERALAQACWRDDVGRVDLTLGDCLRAARGPYEVLVARHEAEERARRDRVAELRADPELLREHFRGSHFDLDACLGRFGGVGHKALRLLIHSSAPLDDEERRALGALADHLGDDLLQPRDRQKAPSAEQLSAVDRLVESYRARHVALVDELVARFGELRGLRDCRTRLQSGELLDRYEIDGLPARAAAEAEHAAAVALAQRDRRATYVAHRDRLAREEAGVFGRLRGRAEQIARRLDAAYLRTCTDCGEIAYPETDGWSMKTPTKCACCGAWLRRRE